MATSAAQARQTSSMTSPTSSPSIPKTKARQGRQRLKQQRRHRQAHGQGGGLTPFRHSAPGRPAPGQTETRRQCRLNGPAGPNSPPATRNGSKPPKAYPRSHAARHRSDSAVSHACRKSSAQRAWNARTGVNHPSRENFHGHGMGPSAPVGSGRQRRQSMKMNA